MNYSLEGKRENERHRQNGGCGKAQADQEKTEVERHRLMMAKEKNLESDEGRLENKTVWVHQK